MTSRKAWDMAVLSWLLVVFMQGPATTSGQGVFLRISGMRLQNDSLVDIDDIPDEATVGYATASTTGLMCVTDLMRCCLDLRRGEWYHPDGSLITFDGGNPKFRRNRDQLRTTMWRFGNPMQRGHFRCELPDAQNVNQNRYVNILDIGAVSISPAGTTIRTVGENFSLQCSVDITTNPLPENVPTPSFEWFFGSNNASLPSGVTVSSLPRSSNTYTSTLQFSPLQEYYAGMYTCRLGGNAILANNAMITVNVPNISVQITTRGTPVLGESVYILTCNESLPDNFNPNITYQWTKANGTQTQVGTMKTLSFSPLKLSDAGRYTCVVTASASYLSSNITTTVSRGLRLQIPAPVSVNLRSSIPSPIRPVGSSVTLNCTVMFNSGPEIDIPLTVNIALSKSVGSPLTPSASGSTYSTAIVQSFGREQSGNYTCTAIVRSLNSFVNESTRAQSIEITTGVYFWLRDQFIEENSFLNFTDIGQHFNKPNSALQCITDRNPCCSNQQPRLGEWYLPNGALVQGDSSDTEFYRSRGDNGEVFLNRPSGAMSPTGRFCCEVPDATDNNQTICVNIGGASISSYGTSTAGEDYTLECSVGSSMATFLWLGPPVVSSGSVTINSNSSASQLQFRPLKQSHNGTYSCTASTDGQNLTSQPVIISVNAPSVLVEIIESSGTPSVTQNFNLVCNVSGAGKLNPTITYQWFKTDETQTQVGTNSNLNFSPLRVSNASNYICKVTVSSSYLTGDIAAMDSLNISIQIPSISSVVVTSNKANSFEIIGSAVTLTCTVKLGPAVVESDLSLIMVDAQLSRDGTTLDLTGPLVTGTTFTYTIQLNSFERYDSGNYTCTATVTPQTMLSYLTGSANFSKEITVTTGVYLSLRGSLNSNNSIILINDIGQTREGDREGGALLCYTDNVHCCNHTSINGRWLLPDRSEVAGMSDSGDFYVDSGPSVVRLHRRNNATSPTGVFCCDIPDATSMNIRTCVDIVLMLPTTMTDNPNSESQKDPDLTGTIVGVVVVALALLIASALIIIVVIAVLRRRSSKPYPVSFGKPPVAYSRAENGEKVQLFDVAKNVEPHIIEFPSDTNITEGEGVYFKIKVSGVPQPTVTWYHDGETVKTDYAREIEAGGSLAIPSAELKHSGVYKAVVANQHGSEEREIKLTVNEEGGASTAVAGEVVSTRPIPVPKFGKYVADLHANSNQPFKDLYQALDSGEEGQTTAYARSIERKPLNRFGNIVVYDENRITLQPLPDVPDCQQDYINASYIDGYSIPKKFIATQGPLPKTVVDFWRLIWQEHPPTIVMVTNVKEGNRIKCQQYWPESGQAEFGPFQVIITDQQVFADYTVRTLSLSLGSGRSHKVTQFHFTAWPDHGVPDYATPILAFYKRVKAQHHSSRGPMVVHCSAGVGRTGTLIVIDNILEQIEKEQVVDIPGAITKIRRNRMKMVQTHEQFTFIHDAILESVTCGDTQITATNLRSAISKMNKKDDFHYQMKILEQVSPNPEEVHCDAALNFPERSRGTQFLPVDRWRVILKGEQPDYIHAVTINGYKHQKAFIIAQGPMESTVRNFWKMIYDRKCAVVVMVSGLVENRQEASAQYWPGSGVAQYGEYAVDLLGEEPLEGFTIRELSVMDNKIQKAHKVTQFHITCWTPDGHCSNLKSVTDVIEEMTKVQIRSGNKPIVVHCNDTVTRSGMFCAIATTIERCKTEGVVDVFQVVKALRVQKPGAVPTVDQYKLIFETALVFLESFDTYANFQM